MTPNEKNIAGVDEVGRGCLFGPVFASAVILKPRSEKKLLEAGLKDSKELSRKQRIYLIPIIRDSAKDFALGQASSHEIDLWGIRRATELAMLRALQKLTIAPELVLVDGILPLRLWEGPQKCFAKGDKLFPSISAASVLAKEARDELIRRLAKKYMNYGLETNVGYGTNAHRKALIEQGPTKLHRKSFLSKFSYSKAV